MPAKTPGGSHFSSLTLMSTTLQTTTVTDQEIITQLNYRLETLKLHHQVGVAVLIQRLRIRGFGGLHLIDAMIDGDIWGDAFYKNLPVTEFILQKVNSIATDNSCLIGHSLKVDEIHQNFLRKGIVV